MADPYDDRPPLSSNSDAWKSHFKPWIRRRIEDLRDELERDGSNVETIRGRIAELRELRAKVEPELPSEGTAGVYFPTGDGPS